MNTTLVASRTVQTQPNLVEWKASTRQYQSSQRVLFDSDSALRMAANAVMQNGYAAIAIDSLSFTASRFIDRETGCLKIVVKVVPVTAIVSEIRVSLAVGDCDQFSNFHSVRRLKRLVKSIVDATQYMPSWLRSTQYGS